eukprot:g5423.t1
MANSNKTIRLSTCPVNCVDPRKDAPMSGPTTRFDDSAENKIAARHRCKNSEVQRVLFADSSSMLEIKGKLKGTSPKDKFSAVLATKNSDMPYNWRSPMVQLRPSLSSAKWQFNAEGNPAVLNEALLRRSQEIEHCINLYSGKLEAFMSKLAAAISFLSEKVSMVDMAQSKAVASSMRYLHGHHKRKEAKIRLEAQISEKEISLQRHRAEYDALQSVYNQQLTLISQLERGHG